MVDFLNSKFMVDLKNGKLPEIRIDNDTIIRFGAALLIAGLILLLSYRITAKV